MEEIRDVVIIGSGPAGLTAGIYAARGGLTTTIFAGTRWGGQLMLTTQVENFPGFPDGILGPELMMAMKKQTEKLGVEIVSRDVEKVDFSGRLFKLMADGKEYSARSVIVATGAETKWLQVPGEQKLIGRGVSSCAPCDGPFFKDKRVVVVGGGDAAMEEAITLSKFALSVDIVHRRAEFRASKLLQERVFGNNKINVIWESELREIKGKEKVEGVVLKNTKNGKEVEMVVDGVFVAIGHEPNTGIFRGQLELDEKGYIQRGERGRTMPAGRQGKGEREYQTMTSREGVFVAGDVHDFHYRQAITAAGFGCQAALEAIRWLREHY